MRISEILREKAAKAVTVAPHDSVKTASSRIAEAGKGLAVVCDEAGKPVGIISVIDINRAVAKFGERAPAMLVLEVMNRDICTCNLGDSVERALELMMERRIRHLPVIAEGQLQGIVNVQDLLQSRFHEAQVGFDEMRRYVFGVGYH